MKTNDFKADDQNTLEEKQNYEAVQVRTTRNAVNVDGSEIDGKCLNKENFEGINGELLNQNVARVKLDELKKVEDF